MLHLRACRFFATPNIEILIIILRSFRRIQARQNRLNSCLLLEEETKTVEIPHRSILRIFDRRNSSKDQIYTPLYYTISIFFFFWTFFTQSTNETLTTILLSKNIFYFLFLFSCLHKKRNISKNQIPLSNPFSRFVVGTSKSRFHARSSPPPPVPPDHLTRSISFFFSFFDLIIRDRGQPRIHPEREKD